MKVKIFFVALVCVLLLFGLFVSKGQATYYDVFGHQGLIKYFLQIGAGTPGSTLQEGDLYVTRNAQIGGTTTIGGTLTASGGAITLTDTTVNNLTVNGTASVTGAATLASTLAVSGASTLTATTFTAGVTGQGGEITGFALAVSDKTATYTPVATDTLTVFTNAGAVGAIDLDIENMAVGGMLTVANSEGLTITVNPGATSQIIGATDAVGDRIQSVATGDVATLIRTAIDAFVVIAAYPANTNWADVN